MSLCSGERCAYRSVIAMLLCPRISPTVLIGTPAMTKYEAAVCRLCRARHNRHTFGSQMAMAGADPFAIMKAMGHTDIKTTMIYVSLGKSHIREQVERLNGIILHPLPAEEMASGQSFRLCVYISKERQGTQRLGSLQGGEIDGRNSTHSGRERGP